MRGSRGPRRAISFAALQSCFPVTLQPMIQCIRAAVFRILNLLRLAPARAAADLMLGKRRDKVTQT
jgi:hypothetical protein